MKKIMYNDKFYLTQAVLDGYKTQTRRLFYAELLDRVSGKGTWESNPFVWVYDFELVK